MFPRKIANPAFPENLPVRDPITYVKLEMLHKAFVAAAKKHQLMALGRITTTPKAVRIMTSFGLYAYLALAELPEGHSEAEDIIVMMGKVYREHAKNEYGVYKYTPTMARLKKLDDEWNRQLENEMSGRPGLRFDTSPRDKHRATPEKVENSAYVGQRDLGNVFLTTTSHLPDAMVDELRAVMGKWNSGVNHVLAGEGVNLLYSPTQLTVEYKENNTWQIDVHTIGDAVPRLVMEMIVTDLKNNDPGRGEDIYVVEGDRITLTLGAATAYVPDGPVTNLITDGIRNRVTHTLLNICRSRYDSNIVLKPRK